MRIIPIGQVVKTSARGEAVDFDKYDKNGNPNPYHGWTLDFPGHVPASDRTYSNKESAQGWYDDPENEPLAAGTKWGGSGDYADKAFHTHTQQYNNELDPNREIIDSSGALGQYPVGDEDLNEYHEQGRHLRPINQTGYPAGSDWDSSLADERGVYSTRPDLNPWPGMGRSDDESLSRALSPPGRRYVMPSDHEDDHEDDDYEVDHEPDLEDQEDVRDQGSHSPQQHLINAGFEYHPHSYNGDRYIHEDHNGNIHTVRAPNPGYGAMDAWHYDFHPHNEQDTDPYAPRNAATDGPRSLSFGGADPEEAYNLHQNLGNDLSELASRGWGTHEVRTGAGAGSARDDNRHLGVSTHSIEGRRRDANDSGYDRIIKTPQGQWAAHHVPDPTSTNRTPPVSVIAEGRSRRDVLDAADHHDAMAYLTSRAADRGSFVHDEGSGVTTWHIPNPYQDSEDFTVRSPGEGAHTPRWTVEHRRDGRTQSHTSHLNWANARHQLMGRI